MGIRSAFRHSLRLQLSVGGVGAVAAAAVVLTGISSWQVSRLADDAGEEVRQLTDQELTRAASQAITLVDTQVQTVTERMAAEVRVALRVLESAGAVTFGEPEHWTATDQVSGQAVDVELPAMLVGGASLGRVTDAAVTAPVVDEITSLLGASATVFQRMNDEGDMLRVATSVVTPDGARAIGTYIPAVGADGAPNAVVSALLSGQAYHGTAEVVGELYVTAYTPLEIDGQVVGALFVGTPQSQVDEPLRAALADVVVAQTGYVTVVADDGTWVVPPPAGVPESGDVAAGLVQAASDAEGGAIVERHVDLPSGAATVQAGRYAPWGWTVAAWGPDSELLAAERAVSAGAQRLTVLSLVAGVAVAVVVGAAIVWVAGRIVARVGRLTRALRAVADRDLSVEVHGEGADEIGVMGDALGEAIAGMRSAVVQMRDGAEATRRTAEHLTASSGALEDAAGQTSESARSAADSAGVVSNEVQAVTAALTELRTSIEAVSRDVQDASGQAAQAVGVTSDAAQAAVRLHDSSSQIASVLQTVTAIAAQTHLLALNATIEAVRAGEAGRGFAVVAGEVKELARQTASAIDTIRPVLEAVSQDAVDVGAAVERISGSITAVDERQSSIAAVVEEQAATTSDVERNLLVAAGTTSEIAESAALVARTAADSRSGALDVRGAVDELAHVAADLAAEVEGFVLAR